MLVNWGTKYLVTISRFKGCCKYIRVSYPRQRMKLSTECGIMWIMKKKNGRPTDWKVEYNELIVKHFTDPVSFDMHFDDKGRPYPILNTKFPTFEGFAYKIGVCVDTLNEWCKPENKGKHTGFSEAYTQAKELQKKFLIESAMVGAANTQFAIFFAKNNLGMKDKMETDLTSNGQTINVMTFGNADPLAKAIEKGEKKYKTTIDDLKAL